MMALESMENSVELRLINMLLMLANTQSNHITLIYQSTHGEYIIETRLVIFQHQMLQEWYIIN